MTAIRTATATDQDAVIAVWTACDLTRPWNDPVADYNHALVHGAATILIAEETDRMLGTVMAGFDGHRGWIYYLGVLPVARGHGVARALLDEACDWLRSQNCPKVELMVRRDNPVASAYRHLGWEEQDVTVFARWL